MNFFSWPEKPEAASSSASLCVDEAAPAQISTAQTMSFKKKKKPLPDIGPSYDDGKLSFSGREEMDDLTENEQRMLTFSEMEPVAQTSSG